MTPLVIGCGNPDRGDDAAGLLVARRLREAGFQVVEHAGDGLSLLDSWRDAADVIIIDAVVSGAKPGEITVWDARQVPLGGPLFGCSTHAVGLAEALRLGRLLNRLPQRLVVYGIEAACFDSGSPLSPEVAAAVDLLAAELLRSRPPTNTRRKHL